MTTAAPLLLPHPGAIAQPDGTSTFAIYAPDKQQVALLGDFNAWREDVHPLEEHLGLWHTTLQLPRGRYHYAFQVDGVRIPDPYAREIVWPTAGAPSSVLTLGAASFSWKHDTFNRPPYRDLMLYEILVADFSPEGNFQGVMDRLDHVCELGVNAIELLPVAAAPLRTNWGYEPTFLFAPAPRYGTPEDLRRLVDAAHGRDIAVILDIVLAHTDHDHPFTRLYPYHESPWYGTPFDGENEFGFPSFDHSKPAVQALCRDVLHHWIRDYHIDGYRIDYAKLIGEREGLGMPKIFADIREIKPDAYIMSEVLPENPECVNRWDTDGAWHESLQNALTDNLVLDLLPEEGRKEEEVWQHLLRALNPVQENYCNADLCVNFVGNHDEARMLRVLTDKGLSEAEAVKRVKLAATLVFCMAGTPLFYHGEEWGESTEKTLEPNPLHWDLINSRAGRDIKKHYTQLIQLRRGTPALRSAMVTLQPGPGGQRTLSMHRWTTPADPEDSEAIIAVNFSPVSHEVRLDLRQGPWRNGLTNEVLKSPGQVMRVLEAFTAEVWVRV